MNYKDLYVHYRLFCNALSRYPMWALLIPAFLISLQLTRGTTPQGYQRGIELILKYA